MLGILYCVLAVIVRGTQWLDGSSLFNSAGASQLAVGLVMVCMFAYRSIRTKQAWYFHPIDSKVDSVIINIDKNNPAAGEAFAKELRHRIDNAKLTTLQMIDLLYVYGVITPAEAAELDAKATEETANQPTSITDEIALTHSAVSASLH